MSLLFLIIANFNLSKKSVIFVGFRLITAISFLYISPKLILNIFSKIRDISLRKISLLSLINMEQELIYRQMEYPKFFINIESDWKSPFYLNSEVIKIIDIMKNLGYSICR